MPLAGINPGIQYQISQAGAESVIAKFKGLDGGITRTATTMKKKLIPNTRQSNMGLMNMGRIAQDAPFGLMGISNNLTFMAEQMGRAKEQGIGFGAQLKGMAKQLTGVGGLTFAFSIVTSALLIWQMQSGKAAKEADGLAAAMKEQRGELFKVTVGWQKLSDEIKKFSALEIAEDLSVINDALRDLAKPDFLEGLIMSIKLFELHIDPLEDMIDAITELARKEGMLNSQIKETNRLANIRESLIGKSTEEIKKLVVAEQLNSTEIKTINKALDKQLKMFPVLSAGWLQTKAAIDGLRDMFKRTRDEINKVTEAITGMNAELGKVPPLAESTLPLGRRATPKGIGLSGQRGAGTPRSPVTDAMKAGLRDVDKQGINIFKGWGNVLKSNLMQAWEDIFGEANSLFEQLIQNWGEQWAQFASDLLFNPNTAKDFLAGGGGGFSKPVGGGGDSTSRQTIIFQIGDMEMGRMHLEGQRIVAERRLI